MIEFGIALPLLAFLIMIVIDSSRGFAAKLVLEDAAARTVERVTAIDQPDFNHDTLRQEAATASRQPLANVTLDKWLECDRARQTNFSDVCPAGQEIGRYLSIGIVGQFRPMFRAGAVASIYGGRSLGAVVQIYGDAAVRLQ